MQGMGWLPQPVRITAEQEEEIGFTLDEGDELLEENDADNK